MKGINTKALIVILLLAFFVLATGIWKAKRTHSAPVASAATYLTSWNPASAANYLDYRADWWETWPPTQEDHGTRCISCHTVVPYVFARQSLENASGETGPPATEKAIIGSVEWRVGHWRETKPFYSDAVDGPGKTAESHSTEAVLNAIVLETYDEGQGHLRPITRTAFDEAWALEQRDGGWKWEDFGLAPWESSDSAYQGAALLAIALGGAPDHYASEPDVNRHVGQLRDYLTREYAKQPLMSQLYVLWASARIPGLLDQTEKLKLIGRIKDLQRSDGGWALASLDEPSLWKRLKLASESDGCATGLVVVALEESRINDPDKTLERGLGWLAAHQQKDGSWHASSLNGRTDPKSEMGRFMTDAATGYAVLALETARKDSSSSTPSM